MLKFDHLLGGQLNGHLTLINVCNIRFPCSLVINFQFRFNLARSLDVIANTFIDNYDRVELFFNYA